MILILTNADNGKKVYAASHHVQTIHEDLNKHPESDAESVGSLIIVGDEGYHVKEHPAQIANAMTKYECAVVNVKEVDKL